MRAKKVFCFFSVLVLFLGLIGSVNSLPDTTVSFRGGGVTINLTYPEEAHPTDYIWHNATLTANTGLTVLNLTLIIRAPVDSTWQEITGWYLPNRVLQENESRVEEMYFQLPSNANGTLQCFIYIHTNQSAYYSSYTFYTTQVQEMTYSELLEGYNLLNNTYNQLVADYDALNNTYNDLQSSYAVLNASYNELSGTYNILNNSYDNLLVQYTTLNNNYNELNSTYNSVNSARNSLLGDYGELESVYNSLNSTFYRVQGNYTDLQAFYNALNRTYYDLVDEFAILQNSAESALSNDRTIMLIFVIALVALIAFIVYLKRGKEEPYVVIRKETVSMNQDEKA